MSMLGTTSIKGLEDLIVKEMREGSLPDLIPFVNEIQDMIEKMVKPDLISQINSGQSSLDSLGAVFQACTATALSPSNASVLSQQHQDCRKRELQNYTVYNDVCSKSLIYADDYVKNCSDFNKINSLPILASTENLPSKCQKNATVSNLDLFQVLAEDFRKLLETYSQKQDSCDYWKNLSSTENATCHKATSDYTNVKQECDAIQHRMDDAYCQAYIESTSFCTNQATCYNNARRRYLESNSTAAALQHDLWVEYQGLMRINCLLDGLKESNADLNLLKDRIATCENKIYTPPSFMIINFTYFDNKAPLLPTAPSCTNPAQVQPGTQAYIQQQYSSLVRPAATCTSQCCVMCQYYSCTAPLTRKTNTTAIIGYTDAECCN